VPHDSTQLLLVTDSDPLARNVEAGLRRVNAGRRLGVCRRRELAQHVHDKLQAILIDPGERIAGAETYGTAGVPAGIPVVRFGYLADVLASAADRTRGPFDWLPREFYLAGDPAAVDPRPEDLLLARAIRHAIERHKVDQLLHRSVERLHQTERNFRNLLERSADAMLVIGEDRRVLFANAAAGQLFKRDAVQLIGQPFEHPLEANRSLEFHTRRHDGVEMVLEVVAAPTSWDEQPAWLATLRETTARTLAVSMLLHEASRDALTGLWNRRILLERIEQEIGRAERGGHALSVAILDLDHFKRVNDTWGHGTGDDVLQTMARILERCCRKADIAARWGGEEFALLMPETAREGALIVAERLRTETARTPMKTRKGEGFRMTASLGVAQWRAGEDAAALMARADTQLYRAKESGRNLVCA